MSERERDNVSAGLKKGVLMNSQMLRDAPLGLQAPFQLDVPGQERLECVAVLRHLPGKRVVFRARWGGAEALVKLFFQEKYFHRERTGLEALQQCGVACPRIIWSLTDDVGYFLATEFLADSASLEQCYEGLEVSQYQPLLKDAVAAIGQLHRNGWMQEDIHLDNFLLSQGKLHVVDGGGMARAGSDADKLNNLGLFFAQMIPDYDALMPLAMESYGERAPAVEDVVSAILQMREQRIKHYIGKAVRNCTQFRVSRENGAFTAFNRKSESRNLLRLMEAPEIAVGNAQFLKQGNSATVVKVAGDSGEWVLKRYNIKSFWHGLKRAFKPSRAWVSWQNAHRLELLGIETPQPLAMRENRSGPFRKEAYLLTVFTAGEDLRAWLRRQGEPSVPPWVCEDVVRLFDILWHACVSHGDMKATNLLVTNQQQLQVIDLDSLQWHRSERRFKQAYAKDLQRFMDNWQGETWQQFARLLAPLAERAGYQLIHNNF